MKGCTVSANSFGVKDTDVNIMMVSYKTIINDNDYVPLTLPFL